MTLRLLPCLALAVFTSGATASGTTGNVLLEYCRGDAKALVQSYVAGFWDGMTNFGAPYLATKICLPDGVTIGQAADMVCRDLERVPSIRHENGAYVVGISMGNAFPCK